MYKIPDLSQIIAILTMIVGFVIGLAGGLLFIVTSQQDYSQVTDQMTQLVIPWIIGLFLLAVGATMMLLGNKFRIKLLGY